MSPSPTLLPITDEFAVQSWLNQVGARSQDTLRTYKMQASRLRAFLAMDTGQWHHPRLVLDATSDQINRFIVWLEGNGPDMPKEIASHFGLNAGRAIRPRGGRSVLAQAVMTLSAMYDSFATTPHVEPREGPRLDNPFVLHRHRVKRRSSDGSDQLVDSSYRSERAISDSALDGLLRYAKYLESMTIVDMTVLRARILFLCHVALWERNSAIASLTWADFQRNAQGDWLIRRDRKSKGFIWALAPEKIVTELIRWRSVVGLPYRVNPDELAKSVFWMGGRSAGSDGPLTASTVRSIIKDYVHASAEYFMLTDPALAAELHSQKVSSRILRLTMAAKFLANGGNAMVAKSILGQRVLSPIVGGLAPFDEQKFRAAMDKIYLALKGPT